MQGCEYITWRLRARMREIVQPGWVLWSSDCICSPPQHQRAHEDHAALRFTFYDVISARPGAPAELRSLQSRCLIPGLYSTHLDRWLAHYPANQVHTDTETDLYWLSHTVIPNTCTGHNAVFELLCKFEDSNDLLLRLTAFNDVYYEGHNWENGIHCISYTSVV